MRATESSTNLEDHNKRLEEVLQRLRKNNLKLQPKKQVRISAQRNNLLGPYYFRERDISRSFKATKEFPTPRKIKDEKTKAKIQYDKKLETLHLR